MKVINLMSRESETTTLVQHKSCKCKSRLCHSKSINKYWCKSKKLVGWISCKDDYTWSPSTCDCKCDNAWGIVE